MNDSIDEIVTELAILSTYKHENIVKLIGFSFRGLEAEIQMEAGVPLSELFHERDSSYEAWYDVYFGTKVNTDSLRDKKDLENDIVEGVKYLHSVGILHNDIRLENIIVCNNSQGGRTAKLIDFGLSCMTVLSDKDTSEKSIEVQSLSYRCPELLMKGLDYKETSTYTFGPDIWATGTLLLFLETEVFPFPRITDPENKSIDNLKNMMRSITIILGSPSEDVIQNYPYPEVSGNSLNAIRTLTTRKRIAVALDYDPEKRVLI